MILALNLGSNMRQRLYTEGQGGHYINNVVILTKLSSLAGLEVVEMASSNAANDGNFAEMTTI